MISTKTTTLRTSLPCAANGKDKAMSFFDCVDRAMSDPEAGVDRVRGERAQAMWREISDKYEGQGHPRHTAEVLAAEDVKAAFKREAGENRHVYLAKVAANRKLQAWAASSSSPDLRARMEALDMKHRGMVRRFNGRLGAYLKRHHRNIAGNITEAAGQVNIIRELRGEVTGDATAKGLADGIRDAIEDLRLMFNERGGLIGKMENYDIPHVHDRGAVMQAKKAGWISQIEGRLDWERIIDPLTGKPMALGPDGMPPPTARQSFLGAAYDNIVFGREVDNPVYGRPEGVATYRKHADSRVLHFKSAEDWMAYNKDFGSGGLHQAIMGHVHRMSRDIVLMEEFGPNPKLGAEYYADLLKAKAAGDEALTGKTEFDTATGLRMMNVMSGGNVASDPKSQWIATFMSSTRQLLTAAFLDRAVIASMSDMNTMRMAAKSMGMNSNNVLAKQVGALKALSRDELLRSGWIADTMADAGTALARFQQEHAPKEWAERVSQAAMRVQGLSFWTDRARAVAYQEWGGHLMNFVDRPLADVDPPVRKLLQKWGVTEDDWKAFTDPETFFRADNGATFALPMNWRQVTKMDARKADDIFFKMQGAAEEFLEIAVPTKSLLAQAFVDPSAYNLPPGSLGYEMLKSAGSFKSFTMTFSINQYRQIQRAGGAKSAGGIKYALDMVTGATIMGALAMQANELLMGRDPQPMDRSNFWVRAAAKGGGFAIIGDIVSTGQASWGGGFASYLAGPVPQAAQDVWDLTFKNAYQAAMGEDAKFAQDLARFGKRYTPLGQTPLVGPALDRIWWDQMQLFLDPESADAMVSASKKRTNLYGNNEFWLPGDVAPSRAPNLANVAGQ
jgi:hypothetical protein